MSLPRTAIRPAGPRRGRTDHLQSALPPRADQPNRRHRALAALAAGPGPQDPVLPRLSDRLQGGRSDGPAVRRSDRHQSWRRSNARSSSRSRPRWVSARAPTSTPSPGRASPGRARRWSAASMPGRRPCRFRSTTNPSAARARPPDGAPRGSCARPWRTWSLRDDLQPDRPGGQLRHVDLPLRPARQRQDLHRPRHRQHDPARGHVHPLRRRHRRAGGQAVRLRSTTS